MSPFVGELLGTMMLILLGNGVVAGVLLNQSKSQNAGWIVITAGWGLAVMCGVFVSAASGSPPAALNPAVSIAAALRPGGDFTLAMIQIAGQFVGAFIGAILVWLAYFQHWGATKDAGLKLACFSTGPAIRNPLWNVVTEAIGTFVLLFVIFAIFSATGATTGSPASGVGPYLVAMLVWSIGMSLGGPTGYAINPARDLGPRIMHAILPIPGKGDSDWGYSWVPVVGPIIGGVIAALVANAVGM